MEHLHPIYFFWLRKTAIFRISRLIPVILLFSTISGIAQVPVIGSFTPASGPPGTTITITGSGFSTISSNNIVYFGAVRAAISSATDKSLIVVVPLGATHQSVEVISNNLIAYSKVPFIPTHPCGEISSSSFAPKVDFPTTGGNPYGTTIKDIDNDGKPDLLIVNGAQLTIYKNTGFNSKISFVAALSVAINTNPIGVATGDLDGDGKPDIVVTDFNASVIAVFRNTSTPGSFSLAPKVEYATGTNPYGVAIGDLNLDGKPEIVVSNHFSSSSTVSVFKNTSTVNNLSFAEKSDFPVGTQPRGIAIGDIDNDGKLDVITANQGDESISVLRNLSSNGSVAFDGRIVSTISDSSSPESIALADFNGDNKLDIVSANNNRGSLSTLKILINASTPAMISFSMEMTMATGFGINPFSVATADLNGDGKPDIAVTNQVANTVSVIPNTSSSFVSFGPKRDFATGQYPRSLSIGDLDGDEKPDLVIANNKGGSYSILRNVGVDLPPSISISATSTVICSGASITFTATAANSGTNPNYQWKVNGVNVGSSSSSYSSLLLKNNDTVTCEVTGNATCATVTTATSNAIIVRVNTSPVASISGDTCAGSILNAANSQAASTITWTLNTTTNLLTETAGVSPNAVTVAGGNGSGSGVNQLVNPNRLFVDGTGNMFIPDMGNARIQKWAPGATSGVTVAGGNGVGFAANQFDRPTSVAMDSKGNLYITDQSNNRIQKWAPGATTGITFASGLASPTGIFIDASDNLYVSQQNNGNITKFAASSNVGVTVFGFNGYGSAANKLSTPTGIFVDAAGSIYICDTDNNRVQKWTPGNTNAITVAGGNGYGSGTDQLANPLGVFVDAAGNVYVSDYNNSRVQKWAPNATSGITVAGGNGSGTAPNQLNGPAGLWMDEKGALYVSDFNNYRVQKFSGTLTGTFTTDAAGSYTATITFANGCSSTSNIIKVVDSKSPQVTISTSSMVVCQGSAINLTASSLNGGTNPVYQWKINSLNAGSPTTNATFTSNTFKAGDTISCMMTSNASDCLTARTAISNLIVLTASSAGAASAIIAATDSLICEGSNVTFTASSNNGGSAPSYNWIINGVNIGGNGPVFSSSSLKNGDVVNCRLTSSANLCPDVLTATSNAITIRTIPVSLTTISVSASDTTICTGIAVTFSAIVINAGTSPVYQWKVNGTNVGTNAAVYSSRSLKNGDVVSCSVGSSLQCATASAVTSNNVRIAVDEIPAIAMRPDTVILEGSSIRLNTFVNGNIASYRWTPSGTLDNATLVSPLAQPLTTTTYSLLVITPGNCRATGHTTIYTITEINIPNAFSPNNDGINDVWSIPGLSFYKDCLVEVFNRYGQLVFKSKGYNRPWDGIANGQSVPVGTYYYIINTDGLYGKRSGSVTILK